MLAVAAAVVLLAGCDGSGDGADPSPSTGESSGAGSGGSSGEATDTATTATTTAPIGQDEAVACPRDVAEPDPALPDAVPEGATSVRLCAGGDDEVTPPGDALVTDVAAVVAKVNAQPVVTRGCADRRLPTYQLAFGYPDGSTFVVAGRFTGCAELLVGSARRAKAEPPLNAFVDGLLAQREAATPPDRSPKPASLDCAQPHQDWTGGLVDPTGLTVAVLCFGPPRHPERARRVAVPPADLRTLTASMGSDTRSTDDIFTTPYFGGADHWLVGTNAWGDPITVSRGILGLTLANGLEWLPRGEARQIIRELVDRAR